MSFHKETIGEMRVKKKISAKNSFEDLFLHSKPVKMLMSLRMDDIQYATQVSKHVDCTYSHTVKVLDIFKNLGLVKFEKKGRIKVVKLTDAGLEIAHDFEGLNRKFKRINVPMRDEMLKK